MKKLIFLFVLIICYISSAQEFKFESSEVFEKIHPNEVYKVVFATPYGFSTYSYLNKVFMDNQKEITITKYDQKLTQVGVKRFNLPKLDLRAADLDEVIETNNQLIFISNAMSKKKGVRNIYAQVYDLESDTISEAQIIASYAIESYSKSGQIEVSVSENNSKIVVLANMPFVKKTNQKIKVWTYSKDLSPIWEASYDLSLPSERAHNQDVHISNSGTVYLVKRHNYNSKKATSNFIIITADAKSEKVLSEPNFFLRNTRLVNIGIDEILVGFYLEAKVPYIDNNSEKGNATSGLFLYSTNDEKIIGKHAFDLKNPNAKGIASVEFVHTNVIGEDLFIVAEKQTYSSKFKTGNSTELDYMYTHGPILLANLNTNGSLKGMDFLANTATYKNELNERASLAVFALNGGLRLLYNKSYFTVAGFYNDDETKYSSLPTKYKNGSSATSYIAPKSFDIVKSYNLAYFLSSNGNRYWLNKMTWE